MGNEKSYGEWGEHTVENEAALFKAIKDMPRRPSTNRDNLARNAGLSVSRFNKLTAKHQPAGLNGPKPQHASALSDNEYRNLLKELVAIDNGEHLPVRANELFSTDPGYMGLAISFGLTRTDRQNAIKHLSGTYESYRYSYLLRDKMILRGVTTIEPNERNDAVLYNEVYRIPLRPGEHDPEDHGYERKGYVINAGKRLMFFAQKQDGSHDPQHIVIVQVTYRGLNPNREQVLKMRGILTDWQGDKFYTTGVCLKRVAPENMAKVEDKARFANTFHEDHNEVREYKKFLKLDIEKSIFDIAGVELSE